MRLGVGPCAMDHGVGDELGGNDGQREQGEGELEALGAAFAGREFAATPGGRGAGAEAPDAEEHGEIDDGAEGSDDEHGDADGVLMEAGRRGVGSAGGGEGAETDGDADAADGEHGGAGALQDGEEDAGEGDPAQAAGAGRSGDGLRGSAHIAMRVKQWRRLAPAGWAGKGC